MSHTTPVSPSLSAKSSSSSFDVVNVSGGHSEDGGDAALGQLAGGPGAAEDEFVVLSRPLTPRGTGNIVDSVATMLPLASQMANLRLENDVAQLGGEDEGGKDMHSSAESGGVAPEQPHAAPISPVRDTPLIKTKAKSKAKKAKKEKAKPKEKPEESGKGTKKKEKKKKKKKMAAPPAQNTAPIQPEAEPAEEPMLKEAAEYISSILKNPSIKDNQACMLKLLQSLIIELGFAYTTLPTSLTAARKFIKENVFINIRDYVATREQGQEALRRLLHPSRSALVKEIRRTNKRASLTWVKKHGLQVLLVLCLK